MSVIRQKTYAFFMHLVISLVVILAAAFFVKTLWYPGFLFEIDGGFQGLEIVFWVDVVLGPVLTFSIFKKGKKGLFFDLGFIFSAQITCLVWGILQTYQERPLALVLAEDTFHTMSASTLAFHGIPFETIEKFPGSYPKRIYVNLMETENLNPTEKLEHYLSSGPSFIQHGNYRPYEDVADYIERYGASSASALRARPTNPGPDSAEIMDNDSEPGHFFFIRAKFEFGIVKVDPKTGTFLSFELL